jgi:hypothetical protein
MISKLPSIPSLKAEVETAVVLKSIAFLKSKQTALEHFLDIEDLYLNIDMDNPPKDLRGFEYHFHKVSAAFARLLWGKGVFIGLSVLDDLLFSGFRAKPPSDPLRQALTTIKDNDVHKPGFVLFPIHSLGINGVGFFEFFSNAKVQLAVDSAGLLLRAQTNSLEASLAFLNSATQAFSIPKKVSQDSIEHYNRSRSTRWLTRNPLLAVRVRMFSGTYYENQQFLVIKLKMATSLLFMMAALQWGYSVKESEKWGSTRRVNSFQTLDIRHYFIFERPLNGNTLSTKCVPMNVRADELSDLSALPIDLVPKMWSRRLHVVTELSQHLSSIEIQYMALVILSNQTKGLAKAVRKIFSALTFFRRSFKSRGDRNEQVANLAIAFEVLLTGDYAPGVGARFKRRIRLALKGTKGSRRMQAATNDLYTARSETVHQGTSSIDYDLLAGQEAFVYVFLGVARRITAIPLGAIDPIGMILGD